MDIISHGLWGGLFFGRSNKKSFIMAFLFGIAPDLLSFGIFSFSTIIGLASGVDWSGGPPDPSRIPVYVHTLYNITHSLLTFCVIFLIVWAIRRRPLWELAAWPLHILLDIPTHSTQFFPTPFLWPLFSYRVDGVSWAQPMILIPNFIFLVVLYLWFFVVRKKNIP